jgi:hypothetical protein
VNRSLVSSSAVIAFELHEYMLETYEKSLEADMLVHRL